MQNRQRIKKLIKWLAIIALSAIAVFAIREFCMQSFRISTHAMEDALYPGDYILVNKLPLTNNPSRNNIVLFKSPLLRDSVQSPLFVSRCVGMPGDTIHVGDNGYTINGKEYPRSPHMLNFYRVPQSVCPVLHAVLSKLNIPSRVAKTDSTDVYMTLTPFEVYQIREELSEEENEKFIQVPGETYSLIIPRKGRAYRLDAAALIACREAIRAETNGKVVFKDEKVYLDGKEINFFFFKQDHYWVLSDNTQDAIDSRHLGFIPSGNILGTAFFCWYSKNRIRFFKSLK